MNTREAAEKAELEAAVDYFAKRAFAHAGLAAEARASLQAATAQVDALTIEVDELKKVAEASLAAAEVAMGDPRRQATNGGWTDVSNPPGKTYTIDGHAIEPELSAGDRRP